MSDDRERLSDGERVARGLIGGWIYALGSATGAIASAGLSPIIGVPIGSSSRKLGGDFIREALTGESEPAQPSSDINGPPPC